MNTATESPTDLIAQLSETKRDLVRLYMGSRTFAAGERLLLEGERDRALYVLRSGTLLVQTASGTQLTLHAPNLIGEMAFLDGSPRSATVVAQTSGEMQRLSWESFEQISSGDPEVGLELALGIGRVLAAKLRDSATAGDHR